MRVVAIFTVSKVNSLHIAFHLKRTLHVLRLPVIHFFLRILVEDLLLVPVILPFGPAFPSLI